MPSQCLVVVRSLLLSGLFGACAVSTASAPDESADGKADRAADSDSDEPLLVCTQLDDAGKQVGELTIRDFGPAEDLNLEDFPGGLEDTIVSDGIAIHEYTFVGSYTVGAGRRPVQHPLDASYFGRLFSPDGGAFAPRDEDAPYRFFLRRGAGARAGLSVQVGPGLFANANYTCTGIDELPTRDSVLPEYSYTDVICETTKPEEGGTATIRFTVRDLENQQSIALLWPEDEEASPISVEPESSHASTLIGGIPNGSISYQGPNIRIWTDEAGAAYGTLLLYKRHGYERGYFRFESGLGDPGFYTTVICELTAR